MQRKGPVGVAIFQANKHPLHIESATFLPGNENCNIVLQGISQKTIMEQREELQSELLTRSLHLTERPFCLSSFP